MVTGCTGLFGRTDRHWAGEDLSLNVLWKHLFRSAITLSTRDWERVPISVFRGRKKEEWKEERPN